MKRRRPQAIPLHREPHNLVPAIAAQHLALFLLLLLWILAVYGAANVGSLIR